MELRHSVVNEWKNSLTERIGILEESTANEKVKVENLRQLLAENKEFDSRMKVCAKQVNALVASQNAMIHWRGQMFYYVKNNGVFRINFHWKRHFFRATSIRFGEFGTQWINFDYELRRGVLRI